MEVNNSDWQSQHTGGRGTNPHPGDEGVERRLARFAFVREERDREVRLLFRDVFPVEIALAFRAAGARLLSIAGERPQVTTAVGKKGKSAAQVTQTDRPQQWTLRYFYSLDETVYTVSITLPGDVPWSVAGVYPAARAIEEEIAERLGTSLG